MKTFHWIPCTLAVLVAGVAPRVGSAAEERPLARNAALQYWQAFSMLPELSDAESEKFSESTSFSTAELDDVARGLADRSEVSVRLLHRGTEIRECDWGLDLLRDGPGTLLPHLSKARRLAGLACLRARVHLADGEPQQAADDLVSVFTLARHCAGSEGLLVSLLVQIAIETQAKSILDAQLGDFDTEARQTLAEKLSNLPDGGSLERAIGAERRGLADWMIRRANDEDGALQKDLANLGANLRIAGGAESLQAKLRQFRGYYDEMQEMAKRPADEFAPAWKKFFARAKQENEFVGFLLPSLDTAHGRVVQHEREMDELLARLRERPE